MKTPVMIPTSGPLHEVCDDLAQVTVNLNGSAVRRAEGDTMEIRPIPGGIEVYVCTPANMEAAIFYKGDNLFQIKLIKRGG